MSRPSPHDPVLVAACRTPVGTSGHAFAGMTVTELAAPVLKELARRAAPLGLPVTDVVLGNCLGPGGNVGRVAALAAGLGVDVPGVTVDRQCGSGLEAVRLAAGLIREAALAREAALSRETTSVQETADQHPLILAGGAESASTAPWRFWPPRYRTAQPDPVAQVVPDGLRDPEPGPAAGTLRRYSRAPFAPDGFPDPEMGPAADALAQARGISRERQDEYAARSHERALAAMGADDYRDVIVPLGEISADQRPRAITVDRLKALPPAFGPEADRTVTAGNSSGISDGAAAVAVTTAAAAETAGLPSVRILASAVVAGDPALPGAGAGPAARQALLQAGVSIEDVDVIEVVEAFAAVALAFADDLGIDERRLCKDGGAVAIGHPWGASGAMVLVNVVQRLLRAEPGTRGLAACAIGGGQGIAMVVERAA